MILIMSTDKQPLTKQQMQDALQSEAAKAALEIYSLKRQVKDKEKMLDKIDFMLSNLQQIEGE